MNTAWSELADRIRGELSDLGRLVQRALHSWTRGKLATAEQDVYLESVALNLHAFYSGLERLFELIARHVDRSIRSGEGWHSDLLRQMANDMANIRPAVIGPKSVGLLDEFRRFRHLVRNMYTFNLTSEKMEPLILALPELWQQVQAELSAFASFLDELAKDRTA